MPKDFNIERVPTNWLEVTGKTWAITGLSVAEPGADLLYVDSTSGRASGYYFNELGAASTGIHATSGHFSTASPVVVWGLVHPATETVITEKHAFDPFFKGFEISILDRDANFKSGIGFNADGRISKVELISGGSGYLNPQIYVSGDGTGAAVEVETFGSGLFAGISGYSADHVSGYKTGVTSIKIVSGGSGYTAGNTHLVISGSGNDQYTIGQLATIGQEGDELSDQGSGAFAKVSSDGFGLRKSYYDAPFVQIPLNINKKIFGGDGQRNFQVQVVARDYFDNLSTGRMQLEFPAAKFEDFGLIEASSNIVFNLTASGAFDQNKNFLQNSLRKLEIHRGSSANFSIITGDSPSSTSFYTQDFGGRDSLNSLDEIALPRSLFSESDYYSGYFYKLLPYDNFGTGNLLSISSGIRLNKNIISVDTPSGFRTLVDQSKAVGTDIQGDVVTNTYLSWKKDKDFSVQQYEVVIEDQVEKESYVSMVNVPAVSGIKYIIDGTGTGKADFDKNTRIQTSVKNLPRTVFDVFRPYSTNGVQWSAHTLYLDNDYLENLPSQYAGSIANKQFVEIPAGNTTSGYVYFTGIGNHHGQEMSYAAADTFFQPGEQAEAHSLVARSVNNEVVVEYEPRIKIPTKKGGSYSFKVRGVDADGRKSLYGEMQNFTASGAASHFAFTPGTSQLRLGGTGDITVSGDFATTVGGSGIIAVGSGVVVVGGLDNRVTGEFGALVGGSGNRLIGNVGDPQEGHFLGGGALNTGSGQYAAMVGGIGNAVLSHASFLGGGRYNYIPYDGELTTATSYSLIGGGMFNTASGTASAILGGRDNRLGANATIGGPLAVGGPLRPGSWTGGPPMGPLIQQLQAGRKMSYTLLIVLLAAAGEI